MQDATYWAKQIAEQKISALELLDLTVKKVEKLNPALNVVVELDVELAKKYLETKQPTQGLFEGVPLALKMLGQDIAGMGSTASSRLFAGAVAKQDDNFGRAIKAAGFIPLAKTNSPEFGFKNITDSALYGDTHNVWNHEYYPGGSSGGAASAVASGMFPLATGGDGGGSIRIPASWSGLIGLKPTRGRTPKGPNGWRGWQGAAVDFGLTVSVRDTARLLAALQTVQEENPFGQSELLSSQKLLNIGEPRKKFKIAFTTQTSVQGIEISADAIQAVRQTALFLEEMGHEVEEVSYPFDATNLIQTYYQMNGAETAAMYQQMKFAGPVDDAKLELMTRALLEYGQNVSAADYIKSLADWDETTVIFQQKIFNEYDIFLTPTTAKTAIKIGEPMQDEATLNKMAHLTQYSAPEQKEIIWDMFYRSLSYSPYPFVVNLTGQAAISLPVYLSEQGLPLGVMAHGSKGSEIQLLELAYQLEAHGQFAGLATQLW
ncbi:MAG: amidase [Lactobacillaceae bacterium]|jgi:amidase|nr:amidase [Lactobacillaceae bacterium]